MCVLKNIDKYFYYIINAQGKGNVVILTINSKGKFRATPFSFSLHSSSVTYIKQVLLQKNIKFCGIFNWN